MKIDRKDFLSKLSELFIATDKDRIGNSDCFIFNDGKIHTSNVLISGQTDFDYDGSCSVNAKRLKDVVSNCTTDEITLDFQESKLKVVSGKFKTLINYTNYEADPKVFANNWTEATDQLINALTKCAAITSNVKNLMDSSISLVHITDKFIEASDKFQLFYYENKTDVKEALVSGKLLATVLKFYITHYNFTKNDLRLLTNNNVILSILLSSKSTYTDSVSNLFSKENTLGTYQIEDTDVLIKAIQRVSLMAHKADNTQNKMVKVQISPGKFVFSGVSDVGTAMEIVKVPHKLKEDVFFTCPDYLTNALTEVSNIKIKDNCVFMHGDNHKRIIAIQRDNL